MAKIFSFWMLVSLLLMASDCNPDEPTPAVLPENLLTVVEVVESTVNIVASADNANFYSFTFYDGADSSYVESSDGTASYSYSAIGVYQIVTRAHSSYYDFIELSETVEITDEGFTGGIPTAGYETPMSYPGMNMVR
ncbi:MAG: hypothetical protein MUQ68_06390, partial [Crocinitomicaceae bacterium]|nr:hypothetical protein [Crocinitomicaceae bacterium]